MKITRLDTLRLGEFPNLLWLRVHTDQGVAGLGETSYAAASVEAFVHEHVAPRVLGRDPLEIESLARSITPYVGWRASSVETRAASALDLALWDLYGKVVNQPLYQVLGGASRQRVRTCRPRKSGDFDGSVWAAMTRAGRSAPGAAASLTARAIWRSTNCM